jgi:hypothetical protein
MNVISCTVAGLSFVPTPWMPSVGEQFEGRIRSHDTGRWFRMVWRGWSVADPSQAIVQVLEDGPRAFDTIVEMRPVSR